MVSRTRSRMLPLLGFAAVVAAGWSAAWWVAAAEAGRQLDAWMRREAANGRLWTCPGRSVDGFPLALTMRCERPTFAGEVAGHGSDGTVEGFEATVAAAHPLSAVIVLRGPLTLRARDDSFLVALSWSTLAVSVPLWPSPPTDASATATRFAVAGSAPGRGDLNLRAAALSGSVAAVEAAPADRRFAFAATGVSLPTMEDALPPGEGPLEVTGSGVLAEATLLTVPTVARLEAWRQAGGALRLDAFRVAKAAFSGTAAGRLGLDEAHRPAGSLDVALVGFEPIAKRLGIPVAGVQLGGLLASVLGGRPPAPAGRGALQLPLTLGEGAVQLGPIPLGVRLSPLY